MRRLASPFGQGFSIDYRQTFFNTYEQILFLLGSRLPVHCYSPVSNYFPVCLFCFVVVVVVVVVVVLFTPAIAPSVGSVDEAL